MRTSDAWHACGARRFNGMMGEAGHVGAHLRTQVSTQTCDDSLLSVMTHYHICHVASPWYIQFSTRASG